MQLRESFESGELDNLRWIEGKANIADALTKENPDTHSILHRIALTGKLLLPDHNSHELAGNTWK